MVNADALRRTLEHIKANRREWDQMSWATCFAGWAVRLADPGIVARADSACDAGCLLCMGLYEGKRAIFGDEIFKRAQELLGLTDAQASRLFHHLGGVSGLEGVVNSIIQEAEEA